MTYSETKYFTYAELECLTYEELSMPLKELLHKLVDENRPVPVKFYDKLCELCDEVNNINAIKSKIEKPKNLGKVVISTFVYIVSTIQGIEYVREKFEMLFEWFSDFIQQL